MSQNSAPTQNDQIADTEARSDRLWPSADYNDQLAGLRAAIGETIYIAELRDTDVQLGVQVTDRPYRLLAVVDFPEPDPARGLAPHLIVLDDGRGLNLGRVARISRRAFDPAPADLLYLDAHAEQTLLFAERRLSAEHIAARSRETLGRALGYDAGDSEPRLTPPTKVERQR